MHTAIRNYTRDTRQSISSDASTMCSQHATPDKIVNPDHLQPDNVQDLPSSPSLLTGRPPVTDASTLPRHATISPKPQASIITATSDSKQNPTRAETGMPESQHLKRASRRSRPKSWFAVQIQISTIERQSIVGGGAPPFPAHIHAKVQRASLDWEARLEDHPVQSSVCAFICGVTRSCSNVAVKMSGS